MLDLTPFEVLPNSRLVFLHKAIKRLEEFNDQTTESIILRNFKPNRHSLVLEKVLNGCKKLKKLVLSFSYSDDSEQMGEFAELDQEVVLKSTVSHLVILNANLKFTNYLIPHLLDKIKILNLSDGRITLEKEMKFT